MERAHGSYAPMAPLRVFGGPYAPIATLEDALADPPRGRKAPPSADDNNNEAIYLVRRPAVRCAGAQQRKRFSRGLNRFRDRLQQLEERLKLDVNGLRQDIRDLQLRKTIMETRTLATRFCGTGSAAKLVREYFAIFSNGFQVLPRSRGLSHESSSSWTPHHVIHSAGCDQDAIAQPLVTHLELARTQNAFLDAMVDPDMGFRSFTGRHVLRDQLERYARCHAGVRMELLTLETSQRSAAEDAAAVVRTRGRLTAYVTQETLENVFPVVLRQPLLCKRLLGSFIAYPFRVEFHVSPGGKIIKYDGDVDFVAALSEVLGSLEDVATVMRHALISDFCMIGHLDNDPKTRRVEHCGELEPIATDSSSSTAQHKQTTESHGGASSQQKAALTYILS